MPAHPLEQGILDNDNDPEVQRTKDDIRALREIGDISLFFKHHHDATVFKVE